MQNRPRRITNARVKLTVIHLKDKVNDESSEYANDKVNIVNETHKEIN